MFKFKQFQNDLDKKDVRNKTALELAIVLDNFECAKILVEHGADCNHITKTGWNREAKEIALKFKLIIEINQKNLYLFFQKSYKRL